MILYTSTHIDILFNNIFIYIVVPQAGFICSGNEIILLSENIDGSQHLHSNEVFFLFWIKINIKLYKYDELEDRNTKVGIL